MFQGIPRKSKYHSIKQAIYIGFSEYDPLSGVYLRTMLLFMAINVSASIFFWIAYILNIEIDLSFFSVLVNQNHPVTDFVLYFQSVFLVSFSALLFWPFVEKLIAPNAWRFSDIPEREANNLVNEVYNGQKKVLYVLKGGLLPVIVLELLLLAFIFFILYTFLPLIYLKLFNTDLYNLAADFQSQDAVTLLIWNVAGLAFYQFMSGVCLPMVTHLFLVIFMREEAERIFRLNTQSRLKGKSKNE